MKKLLSPVFIVLGITFVFLSMGFLFLSLFPAIKMETKYLLNKPMKTAKITPRDTNFGLVIPKISANAKVVPNVDPFNAKEYQSALTRGVAHARGSGFPGEVGNVFIFSHSGSDFFQAREFNAVFYLLDKLSTGDDIYLYYHGERFRYQVTGKKVVSPTEVKYLSSGSQGPKTVTLMTCWPLGTSVSRLIVIAEISPTVEN